MNARLNARFLGHAIGYTLVASLALAGGATALPGKNTVDSADIINGEVKRRDIARSAVNGGRVANGSLTGTDVRDGTLALPDLGADSVDGSKVADGSLGAADLGADSVNGGKIASSSITSSDVANGSLHGVDIINGSLTGADVASNSLDGSDIDENSLDLGDACTFGRVHSFARVKGSGSMPSNFTSSSSYVDTVHTCHPSHDVAFVKRVGTGVYEVVFSGDPAALAMATVHQGDGDNDNTVAVRKINSSTFQVIVRDQSGSLDDGWFQIMTF